MFRILTALGLLSFLTFPILTQAADKPATSDGPAIMVRLQSIDQLLANADYISGLVGGEDSIKNMLGFVRALAGEKGIYGVDVKKPFVLYANLAQEIVNSEAVLMAPIIDKDSLMNLLQKQLGLTVTDEKDGLYSVESPNNMGTIYFRFANNYVYGTYLNKENIAVAKLPRPADVVGKGDAVLSVALRVDRLPAEMRKFALASVEEQLVKGKDEPLPPEIQSPAVKELRDKFIDSVTAGVKSALFDGQEVNLKIDVDSKKDELALEIEMTAVKGSDLAKEIAALKTKKSLGLGGVSARDAAALIAVNSSLPESLKKVLGPAIDDVVKAGMQQIPGDALPIVEPVIKAALPTLKAGDFDAGFAILGPDAQNLYTIVLAGKVEAGKSLEKAIKEAIGKSPPEVRDLIGVDADTIGDTKLHQIKVKDKLDDKARKVVGESDGWLALRDDLAVVAMGPKAKDAIKQALSSQAVSGPVMKMELFVSRLLPLAELTDEKAAKTAAQKAFKTPNSDTFVLTVEGGESLRVRGAMKGQIITFGVLMDKAKTAK
jgi:hypothetical protein